MQEARGNKGARTLQDEASASATTKARCPSGRGDRQGGIGSSPPGTLPILEAKTYTSQREKTLGLPLERERENLSPKKEFGNPFGKKSLPLLDKMIFLDLYKKLINQLIIRVAVQLPA